MLFAVLVSAGSAPVAAKKKKASSAAAVQLSPLQLELRTQMEPDLQAFYARRDHRPLWTTADGTVTPAARSLLQLIESAGQDGLDPVSVDAPGVFAAVARLQAEPSPAVLARAEVMLSRGFAAYVRTMRQAPASDMMYEGPALRPYVPTVHLALHEAALAPSLAEYVQGMRWMHPLYGQLRQALVAAPPAEARQRQSVLDTLQRLRALPVAPGPRYVVVDVASARLWMYEGDRAVDSMRVVVGKAEQRTPLLAGYIRHAILNPYWNVPHDLVPKNIAPNVLRLGVPYLKSRGYEVLSDWTTDAKILDPTSVDWQKVRSGAMELRVRQQPNGMNAMGRVKYEFPNPTGIYLHDTPEKGLLQKDVRQLSSGCIRLEDAERLGRWLFQGTMPDRAGMPEQRVDLPQLVPIYVTYLTASTVAGTVAVGPDPYKRVGESAAMLAQQAATAPVPQQY